MLAASKIVVVVAGAVVVGAPATATTTGSVGALVSGATRSSSWLVSSSRLDDPVALTVLTASRSSPAAEPRTIGPARRRAPWRRASRRRQRVKAPLRIGTST